MLLSDCLEATRSNVTGEFFGGIWAHVRGGNIVRHDGSGAFITNRENPTGGTLWRLSFPSDWIINQSRYYQNGLDPYLRDAW